MKLQEIPLQLRKLEPEMKNLNKELLSFSEDKEGFLGELLKYALVGSGKRVRPCLVHLSASLGHAEINYVRYVAMAVELIHIATLIHDDVIDRAILRRSRQSISAKFGDESAVLLGDYVYAKAFQELARIQRPEIVSLFAETTSVMCQGEIRQVQNRYRFDLSEEDYFSFIEKKTASLFASSCQAGALLGGVPLETLQTLNRFGMHLGIAFQITDDLLDLVGKENLTGKTLRTDLTHGKMTLPLIHLRNTQKTSAEQERLLKILKEPNGQTGQLIDWMIDTGSVTYAQRVAQEQVELALKELNHLPDVDGRQSLRAIADALLERET